MPKVRGLTPKQSLFVKEYLVDLNATNAAIRAGYSAKTAEWIGPRLITKGHVSKAIEAGMTKRAEKIEITADRVLTELARMAFANLQDFTTVQEDGTAYTDLSKVTRDQWAAVQEITVDEYTEGRGDLARPVKRVRVKLADKRGSCELLGRHLGILNDKLDVTSKGKSLADRFEGLTTQEKLTIVSLMRKVKK